MVRKVSTTEWNERQLKQRKEQMRGEVEKEYQASLQRGFTFDGGTFPATGEKRQRVVEIVTKVNAGRGLPQGKSTLRFYDLDGNPHDLDESGVTDLADEGDNLVDAVDDRLLQLRSEIDAATSQSDLDNIDVTAGWAN